MTINEKLTVLLCDLIHTRHIYNYAIPLNIGYIAARVLDRFPNKTNTQLFKFPDDVINEVKKGKADIVALSSYDWNVNLNKAIISLVRQYLPKTLIIMGGPNIRKDDESQKKYLLETDVDMYVINEGEDGFSNILERIFEASNHSNYRELLLNSEESIDGVIYLNKKTSKMIKGNKPETAFVKEIPFDSPWLNGSMDKFINNTDFTLSAMIETNRNCPYQCHFCVWGDFELSKIRIFNLETVLKEIEYICKISNQHFDITIADANFGILDRDLIIAQHIRDMADRYGNIERVFIAQSKNSQKRNLEISKILGDIALPQFAVQTLTEGILDKSGRKNLSNDEIKQYVHDVKRLGNEVMTDILLGLPGESNHDFLDSLKKVTDFGFKHASVADIRVLKGSVYDTDEYRKKYGIETKYRVIPSSYGKYDDIKVIEYEECIRKTNDMSTQDFFELRLYNANYFLLYFIGIGEPLLDYCSHIGMHPNDLISYISEPVDKSVFPELVKYINYYNNLASSEWFDSVDQANEYYLQDEVFDDLSVNGIPKLNYDFAAELIINKCLRIEYFKWIYFNITSRIVTDKSILRDIINICINRFYYFPLSDIENLLEVQKETIPFIDNYIDIKDRPLTDNSDSKTYLSFYVEKEKFSWLNDILDRNNVKKDAKTSIQVVLQIIQKAFVKKIKVEHSVKDKITEQFDLERNIDNTKCHIYSR